MSGTSKGGGGESPPMLRNIAMRSHQKRKQGERQRFTGSRITPGTREEGNNSLTIRTEQTMPVGVIDETPREGFDCLPTPPKRKKNLFKNEGKETSEEMDLRRNIKPLTPMITVKYQPNQPNIDVQPGPSKGCGSPFMLPLKRAQSLPNVKDGMPREVTDCTPPKRIQLKPMDAPGTSKGGTRPHMLSFNRAQSVLNKGKETSEEMDLPRNHKPHPLTPIVIVKNQPTQPNIDGEKGRSGVKTDAPRYVRPDSPFVRNKNQAKEGIIDLESGTSNKMGAADVLPLKKREVSSIIDLSAIAELERDLGLVSYRGDARRNSGVERYAGAEGPVFNPKYVRRTQPVRFKLRNFDILPMENRQFSAVDRPEDSTQDVDMYTYILRNAPDFDGEAVVIEGHLRYFNAFLWLRGRLTSNLIELPDRMFYNEMKCLKARGYTRRSIRGEDKTTVMKDGNAIKLGRKVFINYRLKSTGKDEAPYRFSFELINIGYVEGREPVDDFLTVTKFLIERGDYSLIKSRFSRNDRAEDLYHTKIAIKSSCLADLFESEKNYSKNFEISPPNLMDIAFDEGNPFWNETDANEMQWFVRESLGETTDSPGENYYRTSKMRRLYRRLMLIGQSIIERARAMISLRRRGETPVAVKAETITKHLRSIQSVGLLKIRRDTDSESESSGSDEEFRGSDEKLRGSDEELCGSDEELRGSDEEFRSSDEESGGSGDESGGSGGESCGSDEESGGSDEESRGSHEESRASRETKPLPNLHGVEGRSKIKKTVRWSSQLDIHHLVERFETQFNLSPN